VFTGVPSPVSQAFHCSHGHPCDLVWLPVNGTPDSHTDFPQLRAESKAPLRFGPGALELYGHEAFEAEDGKPT
jgi:hypothetical protein